MNFDSNIFWESLLSVNFLYGAAISIAVAVVAEIIGVIVGFGLALARTSKFAGVRHATWTYIWFFRALPSLLVLLIVWNALPQVFPTFSEPWFTPFIAACVALGFQEAAYMAEIIRSSLLSIDEGQTLAARALGLTPFQSLRKILLPQMTRVALPPLGNNFINMIKYTSLASVISLQELLTRAQVEVASTFRYAEYYLVAAIYYLVMVSILTLLQSRLERKYQWTSKVVKSSTALDSTALKAV